MFSNVSYILFINPRTCFAVWQCQLYFVILSDDTANILAEAG